MSLNLTEEQYNLLSETEKGIFTKNDDGIALTNFKPMSEFNTVYEALGKERTLHKDASNKLKAFGDFSPESIQETNNKYADLLIQSKSSDEDLEKRLADALAIKISPLNKQNVDFQTEIAELKNSLLERDTRDQKAKLKDIISAIISDPNSSIRPEAMQDIYARAILEGVAYNNDVKGFVTSENKPFSDWFKETSSKSLWLKSSTGAGASGGNSGGSIKEFSKMTTDEKTALYVKDPALYDKLKNE